MRNKRRFGTAAMAALSVLVACATETSIHALGGLSPAGMAYRILDPVQSGNLLLFPVVRNQGQGTGYTPFITLDEGLKSGAVEVTEAGKVRGLVRPRGPVPRNSYRADEVNTLVLVNHSTQPLLLLAGEVVTGGKQDRIIAKDRIVPADADPIDLSVFCIEPGRWTESSATFGASAAGSAKSFMVQPRVREQAMVEQDQQGVWNSVRGAIGQMAVAAAPPSDRNGEPPRPLATSSYAKAMQDSAVSEKVDEAAAPIMQARQQVWAKLRDEHAVGVVVAVDGDIIWADLFANTDLLARYWTKLVRSYAAESLAGGKAGPSPTTADALVFLDAPPRGSETSEGEVGIYRIREVKNQTTQTFTLQALLPGTGYDVHVSKVKLRNDPTRPPRKSDVAYPGLVID